MDFQGSQPLPLQQDPSSVITHTINNVVPNQMKSDKLDTFCLIQEGQVGLGTAPRLSSQGHHQTDIPSGTKSPRMSVKSGQPRVQRKKGHGLYYRRESKGGSDH